MPYKIAPANPKRMRSIPKKQEKIEKQDFFLIPDSQGGYERQRKKKSWKQLFGLE